MKLWINVCIIVGAVSLLAGIVSKIVGATWVFSLVARSFLGFADALFLLAIALGVREIFKAKG